MLGEDSVTALAMTCKASPPCKVGTFTAKGLPWRSMLGGEAPIRDAIYGVELELSCDTGEPFSGILAPETGIKTLAFGPAARELSPHRSLVPLL